MTIVERAILSMSDKTAILCMLLATFGFAIQDTVVKILSTNGSLWQLMLLRAFLVLIILLLWFKTLGRQSSIIPIGWFWPILRGVFMSFAYTLFYASLPFVSLSEAATCFFTAPIFVCIFSVFFLRETIGWRRFSAVIVGFIGVALIIQPRADMVNFILILPLLAGLSYASAVIITRGFCKDQPSLSLTFSHNVFYACLGLLMVSVLPMLPVSEGIRGSNSFFFIGWVSLTREILLLIGITSVTHIIAMTATIRAYQTAETSYVAPLEYFYLVFASIIDFFVWKVVLGFPVMIGIILVIISGAFISVREGTKKNSKKLQ